MNRIFFRLVLGGITGKVLGVAREVLLAALFGAGRVVAANRIAQTATLIPINFFTADALTAGFLPLYVQYRQERPGMAVTLYRGVRSLLFAFSAVLVLALLFGRYGWVDLLGPGLDSGTAAIAASMLGISALGVPFYIQFNLYTLVGLAHDDVRLINLRASFQSVGLIGATLVAYQTGRVSLLAWGFTAPYVLLCGLGAFWVRRRGFLVTDDAPAGPFADRADYRSALSMFWLRLRPLLLIPVILQGSIAVERAVGSLLGVEVVAATEYARFVVDSCMALLAAPLGLAGLTSFAKMDEKDVEGGLRRLMPLVFLVTVPLSLMLCLNSTGIVRFFYARGEFDDRAVTTSAVMLLGFALGIWAQVVGYTLVKVMNARGANVRVAVVMAVSFSAATAVNLLLYRYWGAFTLGAASSVGGVLMFVTAARQLGVLRFSLGLLAALLPGAATAAAAGFVLRGSGVVHLAASCSATLLVWIGYLIAVPALRRTYLCDLLRKLKRETDTGTTATEDTAIAAVRSNG